MLNPINVSYHAMQDQDFAVRVEAVAAHDGCEPYYRLKFPEATIYLTALQRCQIIRALTDAPPLEGDGPCAVELAEAKGVLDAL